MNSEEYKKRLEELEKKKEVLEAELTRLSKDFALEKMVGKADTKKISGILLKKEKGSVYIDFALINLYDFKEKKFSKPRYLIFVLLPEKEPLVKLLNLSDAGDVDIHIRNYLEEMKRANEFGEVPRERILKAEAKSLYKLLLKPIEKEIKGKKHLYISPDGNLNLIPFEVLLTPDGKYLMEDYTITYVAAGRDIMRFMDDSVAKGEALIMADPDYDMGLQEKTQAAKAMGFVETRGPAPLSRDAKDMRFKRLPDTKQEAEAIEKCLKESQKVSVRNYQDKNALEEVLLTARNPRILHLATHGYFLKDEEVKPQPKMGFMFQEKERMVDVGIENPMLRSGIALAGANASLKEGRDDGVVSAEKILGLRLKGTDLVVLSACDTGTGEVKSGEGVFGLKRSFILSGAKTVVMSLWSIPSKETTELMTEFYTLMAKGKTKAEALREARLNLMKRKPNPFYWGAFVMVGNPN
jgi:CHAT domain-containing protein